MGVPPLNSFSLILPISGRAGWHAAREALPCGRSAAAMAAMGLVVLPPVAPLVVRPVPVPALVLPVAVDQVRDPVADRAGNHQRRQRVFVDVARQVFAGPLALLIGLLAGAPGQVLCGRRRRAGLLADIAGHIGADGARLLDHAALVAAGAVGRSVDAG